MKKLLLVFIVSITAFIQSNVTSAKVKPKAVSMVSYEQSWLDSSGTIKLKNNTSDYIYNVSFELEYLDMQGMLIDNETFSYNVNIAPEMTEKLDIPAYKHNLHYHYYKTPKKSNHPTFKIRYKLKDFNSSDISISDDEIKSDKFSLSTGEKAIFILIVLLAIYVGMYIIVAIMAQRRDRNPAIWLLLSFIATPILIALILLAIGNKKSKEY